MREPKSVPIVTKLAGKKFKKKKALVLFIYLLLVKFSVTQSI